MCVCSCFITIPHYCTTIPSLYFGTQIGEKLLLLLPLLVVLLLVLPLLVLLVLLARAFVFCDDSVTGLLSLCNLIEL